MTKQHLPLFYFGLFAAYLTAFNWGNPPINWLFFAGAAVAGIQIVRPQRAWIKPLFGLAILFSLAYASSLVGVIADTRDFTPFSRPENNSMFAWNCVIALFNFCVVFFWFKNGFYSGMHQFRDYQHDR